MRKVRESKHPRRNQLDTELLTGRRMDAISALDRKGPMPRGDILLWLVEFVRTDVRALADGPPGDLPNLLYKLRIWLDLEPDEPLNAEVAALQNDPKKLTALASSILKLLDAVADRTRFEVGYRSGGIILDCAKLGTDGGRALSYRDARLTDAVIRVAIDDIYEDAERALRIKRCRDAHCRKIFFAERPDQTYCNHTCSNRTASQRYRERHGRERAEEAHERYKAKRRKLRSAAVIRRIPRKY